mgnify:CR=1 FL=1|jgi:hypothetical protein
MEKDDIKQGIIPCLELLENGHISVQNCASLLAIHILALFEVWKNEQGGKPD